MTSADRARAWSGGGPGMGGKPTNEGPDFGLLVTVAQTSTEADADELRRRLSANGIRSTIAPGTDGRTRILVFRENAARARRLVGGGARDASAD
ncbi:SPOR domain-containing protein [Asanoa hainanensis]|uniref:SPOR domain-containing protein n=1 Tax=Asanoa hainanensis TaxID=560556 RepID=UPI000B781668